MKEILTSRGSSQALHNSLVEETTEVDTNNYYLQRSNSTLNSCDTAVSSINSHNANNIISNSNENLGVVPSNVVAIISIEPTLDESKNYALKDNYDTSTEISTDGSEVIIPVPQTRTKLWPQVLASVSVSLGNMIIGLISAYTSPALASMSSPNSTLHISIDGDEASWIGSLMPLGALIGGIIGGALIEKLGRKKTSIVTAIPFILSWILIASATNIWMIYISRAIGGLCVGIASLSLPVYLAEAVQPEMRGVLGLLPTTIGNAGILIIYVAGTYLDWRYLSVVCAVLSVPFFICMLLIPETPRWFIANGKDRAAEKSLQWLRGEGADISTELSEIQNTYITSKKENSESLKISEFKKKAYYKPTLVSLGLMFLQQMCGINPVIFYTVFIFQVAGSSVDNNLSTIVVGIVNFGATLVANVFIDRLGRKVLLAISDVAMIVSLTGLGTFFYFKEHYPHFIDGLGWIPLGSFMVFVIGFSLGAGPIPWLMLGEIFPGRIRGAGGAIMTAFHWILTFIVIKAFPAFIAKFGTYTAFFLFEAVCIFGLVFIKYYVPETRNRSLEEIERKLLRSCRRGRKEKSKPQQVVRP
ncbi:unnamed protein product [Allacma fusca]|uniref:Major facilitator superfamily (MFS) profile domain-containing protein n=1 Tax=Allacma fusca TaxID=39272 RepID=A0A8J2PWQ0_9HEXA|nr:unnamed protein product [Allacma fusca]